MKARFWILLGLLVPALSLAKQTPVELSMVVTGTITVNPDGSVKAYTIRDIDKLPPLALKIVKLTMPRLEFQPVVADGMAVTAEAGMSVRIVADMEAGNKATVRVAGVKFGCYAFAAGSTLPGGCAPGTAVTFAPNGLVQPEYPLDAVNAGVTGVVYVTVQIGQDGHVTRAAARQVNLTVRTPFAADSRSRSELAKPTVTAALKWRFQVPTAGPDAGKDHWIVTIPVDYELSPATVVEPTHRKFDAASGQLVMGGIMSLPPPIRAITYGNWRPYIPGPVNPIPWADGTTPGASHDGADAIASNGAPFIRDSRFILKTSLGGNGDHF